MFEAPLAQIAYRSRSVGPLGDAERQALLDPARARNEREELTGLLVIGRGAFVQWLEGPRSGVERVWRSIRRDARHRDIVMLPVPARTERLFPGAPLLASTTRVLGADGADLLPGEAAGGLRRGDAAAIACIEGIEGIALRRVLPPPADMARTLLHGDAEAVAALAARAFALRPGLRAMGQTLLGPVARAMGALWAEDRCTSADVLVAQGRLQALMRAVLPPGVERSAAHGQRSALLAMPPGEMHVAGFTFAGLALDAAGWQVRCVFPADDHELCRALQERPHDLLVLAQSDSFMREDRLADLAATIRAARHASAQARLQVLVCGRAFSEQPGLGVVVGADGDGLASVSDATAIETLLGYPTRRAHSPAAMLAQVTLNDVVRQVQRKRFGPADPGP